MIKIKYLKIYSAFEDIDIEDIPKKYDNRFMEKQKRKGKASFNINEVANTWSVSKIYYYIFFKLQQYYK